jgi:membrane-associated phospholipid phosphatase
MVHPEPCPTALRPPVRATVAKLAVIGVYFAVWWTVYAFTNSRTSDSARTVRFERPVDVFPDIIQPWTAVVYLGGGLALPLLPFLFNWSWPRVGFVLTCYAVASAVAFLCYWFWPVSIERPAFDGPGLGEWLMRTVVAVDEPANCFPSAHVLYAILGATLVGHGGASPPVRIATWLLAGAVAITTVTTGQHYFIDVAGGVGAALLGYGAARLLFRGVVGPAPAERGGRRPKGP